MKKENITLIGMAGVGKSTVGLLLAECLGWRFVDIDTELEELHGIPLSQILDEVGDEEFIKLESGIVQARATSVKQVIVPGGSIVYADGAMEILKNNSVVVYLYADPSLIEKRIDTKSRGIVGMKEGDFQSLFLEREVLYKKYADHIVETTDKTPEMIRDIIISVLGFDK